MGYEFYQICRSLSMAFLWKFWIFTEYEEMYKQKDWGVADGCSIDSQLADGTDSGSGAG